MTNELLKFNSKRIKSISNFVEKAIFANWYFLIFLNFILLQAEFLQNYYFVCPKNVFPALVIFEGKIGEIFENS